MWAGTQRADVRRHGERRGAELTRAPKLVTFVEAEYPESEKKRGRAAAVVLKVAISASGAVIRRPWSSRRGPSSMPRP